MKSWSSFIWCTKKAILKEAENLDLDVKTDAKNDAAVIPITQDSLSSTVGYEDGKTDDLWMLVVYDDKKAKKDKGRTKIIPLKMSTSNLFRWNLFIFGIKWVLQKRFSMRFTALLMTLLRKVYKNWNEQSKSKISRMTKIKKNH